MRLPVWVICESRDKVVPVPLPPAAGRAIDRAAGCRDHGPLLLATRYDKRAFMYQGTVDVASVRIWLRDPVP